MLYEYCFLEHDVRIRFEITVHFDQKRSSTKINYALFEISFAFDYGNCSNSIQNSLFTYVAINNGGWNIDKIAERSWLKAYTDLW